MRFAGFVYSFSDTPLDVERNESISAGKKQPFLLSDESVFFRGNDIDFRLGKWGLFPNPTDIAFSRRPWENQLYKPQDSLHKKTEHPLNNLANNPC